MTDNTSMHDSGTYSQDLIVCTLFEGDYHFGVAALVNSLSEHGFAGCISIGYRGLLPPWVDQLRKSADSDQYKVGERVSLRFIHLDTKVHFANFKPCFMQQLLREQPSCKSIWYFDPDIVIRCPWSFYLQWASYGIALCEDVTNGTMPSNHPIRLKWIELGSTIGLKTPISLSRYYNSGFISLPATYSNFLDVWQDLIRLAEVSGTDTSLFGTGSRIQPFYGVDQDALNIAAMFSGHPLTTIGPEGMDLVPGGFTMFHALGSPKPWRKNMLLSALRGVPPSGSDKAFLSHMEQPIKPYSSIRLAGKRLSCLMGALIGRFYRKG
jgi:hypothetical protein